ncbi:nitroreductase family deazaflavin-dependent oxidoreductase [Nitriliruptor alkaliphilus]|uniref:nitroreductase family deazaflavin-dependent oxidoreductase n=1 Tax=Nitriliruptor alkaliphilus TaxID=427918 RepID=UPI0006980167|nr:nitroreductase family deazaflavin-dependent oxidoreductase [Nitriliruptor alkaliphilus]
MSGDRRRGVPRRVEAFVQRIGRTRTFARIGSKLFHRLDGLVFRLSRGRYIVSDLMLPVVMLTTTGRRSGQPRTVPIAAIPDGDSWLVVGSNFGQDHHPAWALNLLDDPRAVVQRRGRRHEVVAEALDEEQRREIWPHLTAYWPPFDVYIDRAGAAGRDIRVFRLTREAA